MKNKVWDVFYFLNELEMLEIRLNILNDYVDKFVIIEATENFAGEPHELMFEKNKERFVKWKDKIIYYVVDDFPNDNEIMSITLSSPCIGDGEHWWVREFYIKESAKKALKGLNDDDIVFVSDIDEVWNPKLTYNPKGGEVIKPKQLPYLYYLNQRTDEDWLGWTGTTCCRYETIKNGILNHIKTDGMQEFTVVHNGGWHFNAIQGKEFKINSYHSPQVNTQEDFKRREINLRKEENDLPEYILTNKEQWKKYLL